LPNEKVFVIYRMLAGLNL